MIAGQTRLFSLGADQRLIEYDLSTCTAANTGLRTLAIRDCVPPGSTGSPCAMCFAPPMPYYSHSSTETLLLVAGEGGAMPLVSNWMLHEEHRPSGEPTRGLLGSLWRHALHASQLSHRAGNKPCGKAPTTARPTDRIR
jgi:hypothetical protein